MPILGFPSLHNLTHTLLNQYLPQCPGDIPDGEAHPEWLSLARPMKLAWLESVSPSVGKANACCHTQILIHICWDSNSTPYALKISALQTKPFPQLPLNEFSEMKWYQLTWSLVQLMLHWCYFFCLCSLTADLPRWRKLLSALRTSFIFLVFGGTEK